jgi:hypothetical protein
MTRGQTSLAILAAIGVLGAPRIAAGPVAQGFVTITPCRALDTRNPAGPMGGPALAAYETRLLAIAGTCGVPANALGLAVNLTAVAPAGGGFAQLYAGDAAAPGTSVLNFNPGNTRASNALVALAGDGSGTVALVNVSAGAADFVLDVTGYFVTACTSTITVTNPVTATGAIDAPFSQAFTSAGGTGATTYTTASPLPAGLTLAPNGTLSGTPTQHGTFPIVVTATDANGCTGSGPTYTLVIACQTIAVTNPATATGTANAPFSQTFTQAGGKGTTTFSTASALPIGMTLAANGVLSGTPTQAGGFDIVVTATDANGCTGAGATYHLVINCQTITVTNPASASGTVNVPFSQTFTQAGAIGSATFSTASALPAGLTLAANGLLSGTPTQKGPFPIVVKVTDANLCTGTGATYNLSIGCQTITVTNPGVTSATAGAAFSQAFTASNAVGAVTFSTASVLPTGLTLAADGTLSGTPTQTGSFPIVVTATDANGCTGLSATYTLVVGCQAWSVLPAALPQGTSGVAYPGVTFTHVGGIGSVTFAETGTLPNGMSFSVDTLSGTPTETGAFPITVTATDANGCTASRDYLLVVACSGTAIALSPGSLPAVPANAPFPPTTFTASGGAGSYAFQQAGVLPAGMTFLTDTLSGTPTETGSFPITIAATDGNGCAGSQSYVVTVTCVGVTITVGPPALAGGTVGTAYAGVTFTASGGTSPYTFSEAGALPSGMTFSGGTLSGTPTQPGTFPVTVTATDANGCTGQTTYSLVIACQAITVTNPSVATATEGTAFDQAFTASGGVGTTTWSTSSTLPTGLTLNASTGHLAGTPTQTGSFPITVTATDANGCSGTGGTYTLAVTCPTITVSGTIPALSYTTAMSTATFTQTGTGSAITWSASGLPSGVSINPSTGAVTGTPTATGTFAATITATDAGGCTGSKLVSVSVAPKLTAKSYSDVGNTQLAGGVSAPATPSVSVVAVSNGDTSDTTITYAVVSPPSHGTLTTFNGNGTFLYTPNVGNTTADSFTYTGTSNGVSATQTATIGFSGMVWYVNNSGGSDSASRGRSHEPLSTIAQAVTNASASQTIFLHTGSSSYAGASLNKAGLTLWGQGTTFTLGPLTIASGAKPVVNSTLTLAANTLTVSSLDVSTGSSTGLTNAGTITGATVENGVTVTTTTGTAVSLNNAGGSFTFQAVSANGGSNGIVLQNTTGSFTVTGTGTAGSGGTIQNMVGGDGGIPGTGIYLSNAASVSLSRMQLHDFQNYAIRGLGVAGFTLADSTISGVNGTNAAGDGEGGIYFDGLTGTGGISNSSISGALVDNVHIASASGTLSSFLVTGCTIADNSVASGNVGIQFLSKTTANMTATVQNSTFHGNRTVALRGDAADGSTLGVTFTGNTIVAGSPNQGNQGIEVSKAVTSNVTFAITNNRVGTPDGTTSQPLINTGINVFSGSSAGTMSGTVTGNTVLQDLASSNSGSGIVVNHSPSSVGSTSSLYARVDGNVVSGSKLNYGILVDSGGVTSATGNTQVQITNNTVQANMGSGALDSIRIGARRATTACYRISGNTATTAGSGFFSLFLRKSDTSTFNVEGLAGGLQSDATTIAYEGTQNPAIGGPGIGANAGNLYTGVAAGFCSQIP